MGGHERFEELAVGHVLGGLDDHAAAEFRTHLIGCRDCRVRVAELRDIASGLDAIEREERAQARLKTEVEREARRDDEDDHEPAWNVGGRAIGVGLILLLGAIIGLAYWNLSLRQANQVMLETTRVREATLERLSSGVAMPADLSQGVTGIVVSDGDEVAVGLAGLPPIAGDQRVVLWLMDGRRVQGSIEFLPGEVDGGLLATHTSSLGADALLVTFESAATDAPGAIELVAARLQAGSLPQPAGAAAGG